MFYSLQSFWAKIFFYCRGLLVSEKFLYNTGFALRFYSLRRVSSLFWVKSIIFFFFKFIHWFKICLTRIVQELGANRGTLLQKEEGKMKKERKKGEQKLALSFFFAREKMATARGRIADIRTQAMTARSAAQTASPPQTSRVKVDFRGMPYKLHHS